MIPCFVADTAADYTWIEDAILTNNYYDRPGIWGATIDADKRRIAAMIAGLEPRTVLDVGCANGTVIECLLDLGIAAFGLELSESAIAQASPNVGPRITLGNASDFSLDQKYGVISGLDIFEHVPPQSVLGLIEGLVRHLDPGGLIFANIPAFGLDRRTDLEQKLHDEFDDGLAETAARKSFYIFQQN